MKSNYIGLAQKAGEVVYGVDNILTSKKKIYLILLDNNISENSKSKIVAYSQSKNINLIYLSLELDKILHTNNCKVVGITNLELANQIII